MSSHNVDKLLSFLLVVVGLCYLAFANPTGNVQFIGLVVVIGGVLGLVNAQVLSPVLQLIEKQLGLPLSVTSATTLPTTSQGVSSTTSSNTSSTQAANTSANVAIPGTRG